MFAVGVFNSVLPAYGVIAVTLGILLGAAIVVASRVLTARQVQCPATGESADIVVESRKTRPWTQSRRSEVAQCSLLPTGVTCAQRCLECPSGEH